MNDYNKLDNYIKNLRLPALLLFIITILDLNDNITKLFIKFYLKNHYNLIKDKKKIFINKNKTYEVLNDFDNISKNQIIILRKFKKIKSKFTNKFFWKKDLKKQLEYLEKLFKMFLALCDCSNTSMILFHKLETLPYYNDKIITYHSNLIYTRLSKIYNLLGYKFFKNHKISIITELEFCNLDFNNKIIFFRHIYSKINLLLKKYIYLFKMYIINQKQLLSICNNYEELDISLNNFDSEIEYNDIIY